MSSEPEDLHAPQYQRGLRHQRSLRGIAAAVFATFVALASHMIGGGALPSAMGVVVPLVLSMLVCVLLAGRRLSLLQAVPVCAGQPVAVPPALLCLHSDDREPQSCERT